MFNQYPYLNENDLNLDYILASIKKLKEIMDEFITLNSITFADPVTWNITSQYAKNTVVIDTNGNAYLSKEVVPGGVQLNNSDYWLEIFNFTEYTRTANQNLTVNVETNTTRATAAYNVDDWLIWNDILYKVTAAIAIDDALIVAPAAGANIIHFTVEDFIKAFMTWATNTINQYKNDIDASELAYQNAMQAEVDRILAGATVDSEVIDARLGADGVNYPTLGAAIRTQFTNADINTAYSILNTIVTSNILSTQISGKVVDAYTKLTGTLTTGAAWRTTGTPSSGSDYNYTTYTIASSYRKNFIIISGQSWGKQFPLVSFYDANDKLLGIYGTLGNTRYTNVIVLVPENTSKMIINGDNRVATYLEPMSTTAWNLATLSNNIFTGPRAYGVMIDDTFLDNNPTWVDVRSWTPGFLYYVADTVYPRLLDTPAGVTNYFSLLKFTMRTNRTSLAYNTYILANSDGIWLGWDDNTKISWFKMNDYSSLKMNCSFTDIAPTNTVLDKAKHTNGTESSASGYMYCEYDVNAGETYVVSGYHFANTPTGGYPLYIVYDANDTVLTFGNFGTSGKVVEHFEITVPNNAAKMIINGITGSTNFRRPLLQQYNNDFTVDDLYQKTKPRRYLFIGDSYLEGYSHDGNNSGWGVYLGDYLGLVENTDYVRKYKGGARFSANAADNTFIALLNETEYPFDYFTDIVVCGGYNDHSYTENDILTGISSFISRAKKLYPNATIHIGCIGYNKEGNGSGAETNWATYRNQIINTVIPAYQKCVQYAVGYLNNVEYWLSENGITNSDGYHPSEAGNRSIARAIGNALLTGCAPLPYDNDLRLS